MVVVDQHLVRRFAEDLQTRGKQPATIESYCRDAQRFLDYLHKFRLAAQAVEAETLIAYQDFLRTDCAERDNSVRRTVIGIRQFYRYLTEQQIISTTPFDHVPIPERDERLPRGLTDEDVDTLLTVAAEGSPEFKAARDVTIVSLLAYEGIKANELINLKWKDVLFHRSADNVAQAGEAAVIHISGARARAVTLSTESSSWLRAYQERYAQIKHPSIAQASEKYVFIAFKGREAASPLPVMTRHGLKFILYELGEKARLKHLNTEQLRHFSVNYLLSLGKSPEEIMLHLGLRRLGNISKHLTPAEKHRRPKLPKGKYPLPSDSPDAQEL